MRQLAGDRTLPDIVVYGEPEGSSLPAAVRVGLSADPAENARSVLALAKGRSDALSNWALALQQRRGYWRAVVAIASKNARLAWAVLHRGENFTMPT